MRVGRRGWGGDAGQEEEEEGGSKEAGGGGLCRGGGGSGLGGSRHLGLDVGQEEVDGVSNTEVVFNHFHRG